MKHHRVSDRSYVRKSREPDIAAISRDIRKADRDEIMAAGGQDPWEALYDGYTRSEQPWTLVIDSQPAAMFGVVSISTEYPRQGAIWLLGTDAIGTQAIAFTRHAKKWLDKIAGDYEAVGNWVDARNDVHVRFLQCLGFQLGDAMPYGVSNEPFIPFSRVTNTCATPSPLPPPSVPD